MQWTLLGIDIAKHSFDAVVLLPDGKQRHRHFENTRAGHQALRDWLQHPRIASFPTAHACMEATGTYWEALATFLVAAGLRVSVVNPKRITHFAKSRLSRAKTDKVDAGLIAEFCRQEQPALWTPPAPQYRQLQLLLRHREALECAQQRERNRVEAAEQPPFIQQSLEAHLAYLATALEAVERAIREHLGAHPELQAQLRLLCTIPGVGEVTARWLLAELAGGTKFRRAPQAAAFAGLDPRVQQSGLWKGKTRLSKQGDGRLRKALFLPAMAALRWNPFIRALAARLRERGKCGMAIVGAAMRKLVHLAFGVLRHGKAFDPGWAGAG